MIALFVTLGIACNQPPAGRGAGEVQTSAQSNTNFKIEKVAGGLEVPWSIVWAPDGRMIFTERPGRVRVIEKGIAAGDRVIVSGIQRAVPGQKGEPVAESAAATPATKG